MEYSRFRVACQLAYSRNQGLSRLTPPCEARMGGGQPRTPVQGLSSLHITAPHYSATVYKGGNLLELRGIGAIPGKVRHRGEIKGFSRGSRRRLLRLMGKLNLAAAGPCTFVTLTYPDEFPADRAIWTAHRDEFLRRIRRQFPGAWGLWRREVVRRKSGGHEGSWAPHFHLLLWGVPQRWTDPRGGQLRWDFEQTRLDAYGARMNATPGRSYKELWRTTHNPFDTVCDVELFEWVSLQWYHIVGSHHLPHFSAGTRVEPVRGDRGVFSYCAKYIAKAEEEAPEEVDRGRQWGAMGLAHFNWAIVQRLPLSQDQFYRLRRVMRRYLERQVKHKVGLGRCHGMSIFTRAECWLTLIQSTR